MDVFWMNMEKFIIQNFEHLDPMSIENLIFVFTRISRGSKQFWGLVYDEVEKQDLIANDNVNQMTLMSSLNQTKHDRPLLWQAMESQFHENIKLLDSKKE